MRIPVRAVLTLTAGLLVGSCVSSDSSTGVGDAAYPARVAFQPSVVPTAADASALPINRIRAVTSLWPSNVVLADTTIVVDPDATEWDLTLDVRLRESPVLGHVFLYLINQADSARIQYSGKTDTMTLSRNGVANPGDVPLVRGPLANLYVTSVSITSPGTLVERRTLALSADVTSSSTSPTPPVVFWTSLDTAVVTVSGNSAYGVRPGSAQVVATAGILADTATVSVTIAPVGSVEVSPPTANVVIGTTTSLAATVRDDEGVVLTGRPVRWASESPAVATVDSLTGLVTAVALGTTTVTATSEGVSGSATVNVVPVPVATVLVSPDSADVDVGATVTFSARTLDATGAELTGRPISWATGNAAIATVDDSGVVRGVAAGATTVSATSEGVTDQAVVVVLPPPGGPGGVNTWIAATGTWSTAANWSLGRVPIPEDTVRLTQGVDYAVTLDTDVTVERLTIGGTTDLIGLNVDDWSLTVTDTGPEGGIELLPLGGIQVGNGSVSAQAIVNNGSIRVVGTGTLEAATILNNTSLVVAATGTLAVDHPTAVDFLTSGTLTIEDGAVLVFPGGANKNFSFLGGSIDGTGGLLLGPLASLILESELTIDGPQIILQGAATVASGANRLTIGPTSALSLFSESGQTETNTVVVNQGVVFATGPSSFMNDSLYVETGGQVWVQASAAPANLGTADVVNDGFVVLTGTGATFGPGGTTGRRILNTATGEIATWPGSTSTLNGELVNAGTLSIGGPTELSRRDVFGNHVTAAHANSGSIITEAGDFTVVLGGSAPSFTNTGTLSVSPSGAFRFDNLTDGTVTNAVGGQIVGEGTIEFAGGVGGSNLGTVSPGFSPGVLTWLGDLSLGFSSTLEIELGGTSPGTFDQIDVSGPAVFDGLLAVDTFAFVPSPGDRFPVVTFGSRAPGAVFENISFPTIPGITFDTLWAEAGSVDTLYIVASAAAPTALNRWVNPSGGNWSVGANWSSGAAPVAGDSAVIDEAGAYTVTLDVAGAADHLLVGGPSANVTFVHDANTLTIAQSVTVAAGSTYALGGTAVLTGAHAGSFDGDMLWSGGTWGGAATTTLRSTGNVFSGGSKTLDARSIVNEGTLAWTGGLISPSNSSTFLNASGAIWLIQGTNATYSFGTGVSITNEGSITRDTSAGIATISADLANNGSFDVLSGDMRLNGNGIHNGSFTVDAGARLTVSSGVHDFAGSVSGAGDMVWTGGVSAVSGSYSLPAIIVTQPPVTFSGSVAALDSIVMTGANALAFNTAAPVQATLWKVNAAGSIAGSAPLVVLDSLEWGAGTIQGSAGTAMTIAAGASAALVGAPTKTLNVRNFEVEGTAVWTAGTLTMGGGADLTVLASGSFDVRGDLTVQGTASESINVAGTFIRSTTTGTAVAQVPFSSVGLLSVQAGTLQFTAPVTNSGTVDIGTNATLDLDAASTHAASAVMQGLGTVNVEDMIGGDLSGDIAPGGIGANGTFTWISDYDPSTTHRLLIELAGPAPGKYDVLNITGGATAAFAGTLEVGLIDGYVPAVGDTIPVVTFDARAGTFQAVSLPALSGVVLDTLWTGDVNGLADVDTLYIVALSTPTPMLFTSLESGNNEIWLRSADGLTVTQLTSTDPNTSWDPEWSPDGSQIVFTTDRDGVNDHVWIMEADGSLQTEVTFDGVQNVYPSWSPDGAQIVWAKGSGGTRDIWTMNKDGTGATQLTNSGFEDSQPDWSPDGTQIVFYSARNTNWQIYTMDSGGVTETRRTNNSANDFMPQYSPDGSRIVFVSDRNGGDFEIYVMNADGSGQTRLTASAGADLQPSWSADGRHIVFSSVRSGDQQIHIMDADGSNVRLLDSGTVTMQFPDLRGN